MNLISDETIGLTSSLTAATCLALSVEMTELSSRTHHAVLKINDETAHQLKDFRKTSVGATKMNEKVWARYSLDVHVPPFGPVWSSTAVAVDTLMP